MVYCFLFHVFRCCCCCSQLLYIFGPGSLEIQSDFAQGQVVGRTYLRKTLLSMGVSNGPIQSESARKIWPLLELLAKIR